MMPAPLRVVLYGAGAGGKYVLTSLDSATQVVAVADGDVRKHGACFCGYRVCAPEEACRIECDHFLVATVRFAEVRSRLVALGVPEERIRQGVTSPGTGRHEGVPAGAWSYHPLVSIVMPVFNRASVVARAVRSVVAQSYAHWELHVVDDGSVDDSALTVEREFGGDGRIKLHRRDHFGVSQTRNAGVAACAGDLIAYLDSDNRWHPDFLHHMVARFADEKVDCGYAGMNVVHEAEGWVRPWTPGFDRGQLEQMNFIDLNVFMHRRALWKRLGGFDEQMTRLVDWDLVLRYTRDRAPFVVRGVLADYYIRGGGNRITETETFLENYERLSRRNSLNSEEKK